MDSKPTVFVVDDDPGSVLAVVLADPGTPICPVCAFGSGREFLEAYRPSEPGCLGARRAHAGDGRLEVQQLSRRRAARCPLFSLPRTATCPPAPRRSRPARSTSWKSRWMTTFSSITSTRCLPGPRSGNGRALRPSLPPVFSQLTPARKGSAGHADRGQEPQGDCRRQ